MITLFKKYPQGSNITLLNTIYHRPEKDPETDKWSKGAISLIGKDLDTGKKIISIIEDPLYEFYTVKPEYYPQLGMYYHNTYPIEWLDLHECEYVNLDREVARHLDLLPQFYDDLKTSNKKQRIALYHTDNRIVRSQMNISDFYRYKFDCMYQNNPYPLHKGYFDIEADALKAVGEFPESGEVPINSVTFIDSWNKKGYVFLLEDKENPQYYEFKKEIQESTSNILEDIQSHMLQIFNGDSNKLFKYNIVDIQFEFFFYNEEDEIELIRDLFRVMAISNVDFVMAWNMRFDIPYIIDRCKVLGYNPIDIICHPLFKYKDCEYILDDRQLDNYHLRSDYANISVPYVLIDQLLVFSGRRKSQITSIPNFKLDTIAGLTAGCHKIDYSHITNNLKYLPKLNYRLFVIYNVMDVINQICIEESEKDIDYIFALALESNTRYSKLNKPSIVAFNEAHKLYEKLLGLITGNNINAILKPEKEKYDGAYVSEPRMLDDHPKMKINGTPIQVCNNVVDEDATSMYPSEDRNFNMSNETQIGKIIIPQQVREDEAYLHEKTIAIMNMGKTKEKDYEPPVYNRGGTFIEDFTTNNWLVFANRWLGLKNYKELLEFIMNYYTQQVYTNATIRDINGSIIDRNPDIKRIPWYIKTEQYKPKSDQIPWKIVIPTSEDLRRDINEYYSNIRIF